MPYTKKNPSPSNQYTDTTLFGAFDQGIYDAHQGMPSAKWWGLSTTNTAAQNKTALQTAMNELAGSVIQGSGAMLYIPAGDYSIEGGITQPGNIILTGDGPVNTRLNHTTNDTLFTSLVTGQTNNSARGWQHLKISGNSGASARGILVGNCRSPWIMDVQIVGYSGTNGTCLELHNGGTGVGAYNYTEGTQIYNLITLDSKYHIRFVREANGNASFSDTRIFGSYCDLTTVAGAVGIHVGDGCFVYGSTFDVKLHTMTAANCIGIQTAGAGVVDAAYPTAAIVQSFFNVMYESNPPNPGTIVKMNSQDRIMGFGMIADQLETEFDSSQLANRGVWDIASGARFRVRGQEEEISRGEIRSETPTLLFDRELVGASPASNTYYKLATLPVSSSSTREKLKIEFMHGFYDSTALMDDWVIFSNRNAFAYTWNMGGKDSGGSRTSFRIQAFLNAGVVTVYARFGSGLFAAARVRGVATQLGGKSMTNLGIGQSTTTVPTGTVVFDSGDPATYAPNAVNARSLSADRGNNSVTLTLNDHRIQRFNTVLTTANKTVTLPTAYTNGETFKVLRQSGATGAFTIVVNDPSAATLHTFASGTVNVWAEFMYTGSAWIKTASGSI